MDNEVQNLVYEGIDREYAGESASTRRKFVAGAGTALGGMGLMGLNKPPAAIAEMSRANPQNILNVAAKRRGARDDRQHSGRRARGARLSDQGQRPGSGVSRSSCTTRSCGR